MANATTDTVTDAPKAAMKSAFDKLQTAGTTFGEHNKANLEAMSEAAKITMKSLEEAGSASTAYMKTAAEKAGVAMKAFSGSKSIQEAVEVQTDYARSALDDYLAQFNKVTDLFLGAIKASAKPISERVSASVSALQAAK